MQKPIKLCYILPDYNSKTDTHFFHLYEFLEKASKELDVFLIVERSNKEDIGSAMPGIKNIYVQKFKFIPFRFVESFIAILIARIKGYKNFYTHYCYIGGINAAVISRIFGGKSYYWNCAMNWLFKKKNSSKIGYELCLKWSHYLITGSEEMKKGYANRYNLKPEKIKVMPNWLNLERFQPSGKKNNAVKNILFVHWLSKRKGVDMIVPIVLKLKQTIPDFKLTVIGHGPYKEKLLEEVKENNLENLITVLGGVPQKEVVEHYDRSDIFIMPSMEEGFPRVLLEAMAMGVPYVATDVGAVREMSPETAQRFLTRPGEVEKFVQKIEVLMTDQKTYKKFRDEELEHIKNYSLENVLTKFLNLFK